MSKRGKKRVNYSKGINGTVSILKRLGINGISWILSICMLLFALVAFSEAGIIGGILFLIGAIVINPLFINFLANRGFNLKKIVTIPTLIVTMFAGIFAMPSTEVVDTEADRNIAIESEIEDSGLVVNDEEHQVLGMDSSNIEEAVDKSIVLDDEIVDESTDQFTFTDVLGIKYAQTKLNVRDLPNESGSIVGSLEKNEAIDVTGKCDQTGWYRIAFAGGEAYVINTLVGDEVVATQAEESREIPVADDTTVENVTVEQPVVEEPPVVVEQPSTNDTPSSSGGGGSSVIVPGYEDSVGNLVWVPTNGGTKYHSKSSCSNMDDPMQVTVEHAEANGYTPCKRCH